MNPNGRRILVVEDEGIIALTLKVILERAGYEVVGIASRADQAVRLALRHRPALTLMDVNLDGERDGIDAAREIGEHLPTRIVFLTAYRDTVTTERMHRIGAAGILTKPVDPRALARMIEQVLAGAASGG